MGTREGRTASSRKTWKAKVTVGRAQHGLQCLRHCRALPGCRTEPGDAGQGSSALGVRLLVPLRPRAHSPPSILPPGPNLRPHQTLPRKSALTIPGCVYRAPNGALKTMEGGPSPRPLKCFLSAGPGWRIERGNTATYQPDSEAQERTLLSGHGFHNGEMYYCPQSSSMML